MKPKGIYKQYFDWHDQYTKKYNDRTIILMMVGSFYEIYSVYNEEMKHGPDLSYVGDLLNCQVTRKDNKKPGPTYQNPQMIGFPMHALLKFQNLLLSDGYTVVIVDQVTPPPNPERKVTSVLSPGTVIEEFDKRSRNLLISIYIEEYPTPSHKKIYCVGISAIDIATGENWVHSVRGSEKDTNLWEDEVYRILHNYDASEILIHSYEQTEEHLRSLTQPLSISQNSLHINFFKDKQYKKPSYQNDYYHKIYPDHGQLSPVESIGLERLPEALMAHLFMVEFIYEHKVENIQKIRKPIFRESENHLVLSHNCLYQLYLVDTKEHEREHYSSVLSLINRCVTAIGRRLCKDRLLYPLIDRVRLQERYDHINSYLCHDYQKIVSLLRNINDLDRLFRKMSLGLLDPYEFYNIHSSLGYLDDIHDILTRSKINHAISFNESIALMKKYRDQYKEWFKIDTMKGLSQASMNIYIFKRGVSTDLDALNDKYNGLISDRSSLLTKLGSYIDKKNPSTIIKIEYTDKNGYRYYLTPTRAKNLRTRLNNITNDIKIDNKITIKNEFKLITQGSKSYIESPYLTKITDNISFLSSEIEKRNRALYLEKIKSLSDRYATLFQELSKYVGEIDLYASHAKLSIEYGYVCPQLSGETDNDRSFVEAYDIRHPLVERIQTDIPYVANDIRLSENGILLYGTNACGKSTLMKSVGISIVMAQAGFFVPCSKFIYSPYTQIFTRILNNDNLFQGQSSFAVEMSELRSILVRANEKSLVLGDELCSGTEHISAISIVSAGLKWLSNLKCSFIFTSHLHQLMDIPMIQELENLSIYHLKILYDEERDLLIYDRKLEDGSGPAIYGLEVCKAMGLDKSFISDARKIQLMISGENPTLIHHKQSHYNSSVMVDACQICDKKDKLETHHIKEQKDADEHGMIGSHHKNISHNLVTLCHDCHMEEHHGNLTIKGYIQSDQGRILDFERSG